MNAKKEVILLLMSGGVDSSVSALLLKDTYDIIGVTMKIPNSLAHIHARKIAEQLGIRHITVESENIFTEQVIDRFVSLRKLGMTPNPCADCNKALKFGAIPRIAGEMLGMSDLRIATGHYAEIKSDSGHKYICRASDTVKDQSYFLCDLSSHVVQKLLFPLGKMNKREIRSIAKEANLETVGKPESMDTCFNITNEIPCTNGHGNIIGTNGIVIGRHKGITNYTIGQRKGLGIAAKEPLYVLDVDATKNSIIVGTKSEAFKSNVHTANTNNMTNKPPEHMLNKVLYGKTRSRGEPSSCRVTEISNENFSVEFQEPQFAPTPGQRLVCYNEHGLMLLSGIISKTVASDE